MSVLIVPLQFDTVAGCVEISTVVLKSYTVYSEVGLWLCVCVACIICMCVSCVSLLYHTGSVISGCKGKMHYIQGLQSSNNHINYIY